MLTFPGHPSHCRPLSPCPYQFTLARTYVVCLIPGVTLQLESRLSGSRWVAKPALSGFLALLLLICGILSVSRALHQLLHDDAAGSHHLCLACSFAKGQISAADVALVAALLVLHPLASFRPAILPPVPAFDYRLSPSRAPPALISLLSVVA